MGEWIRVCRDRTVREGLIHIATLPGGKRILLVRLHGTVYASDDRCTHEDADMSEAYVRSGGLMCPVHLSLFDPKTGKPQNPPATEPMATYPVKIEDDAIHVEV